MSSDLVAKYLSECNQLHRPPAKAALLSGLFRNATEFLLSEQGYADNEHGKASPFDIKPYDCSGHFLSLTIAFKKGIGYADECIALKPHTISNKTSSLCAFQDLEIFAHFLRKKRRFSNSTPPRFIFCIAASVLRVFQVKGKSPHSSTKSDGY